MREYGKRPAKGDLALSSLLNAHGHVMNGGILHAVELLDADELALAQDGYRFFGLSRVADLLSRSRRLLEIGADLDTHEAVLDHEYHVQITDDSTLYQRFVEHLRLHPGDFSPLGEGHRPDFIADDSASRDTSKDRDFDFSGRHLLASYSGCDAAALADVERLSAALHTAIEASGAALLKSVEHVFPPHGFTAVALLSESHASIHTYPEHNSCFVDIFTCGTRCNVEAFDAELRRHFRPQKVSLRIIHRYD